MTPAIILEQEPDLETGDSEDGELHTPSFHYLAKSPEGRYKSKFHFEVLTKTEVYGFYGDINGQRATLLILEAQFAPEKAISPIQLGKDRSNI